MSDSDPSLGRVFISRANGKYKAGDVRGALQDYDQGLLLNPTSVRALVNRAAAKSKLGDPRGALDDCTEALCLDPKSIQAFVNRAAAKNALGDHRGAVQDCTKALHIDGSSAVALRSRADAKYKIGDTRGAITDYQQAIQIDPAGTTAFARRAEEKLESGDHHGALEDYDQALVFNPLDVAAFYGRASCRHRLGNLRASVMDYSEGLRLDPHNVEALQQRAALLVALGDRQSALADYDECMRLEPSNVEAFWARARLRKEIQRGHAGSDEKGKSSKSRSRKQEHVFAPSHRPSNRSQNLSSSQSDGALRSANPCSNSVEIVEVDQSIAAHDDPYKANGLALTADACEPSNCDGLDVIVDRGAEFRAAFDALPDTDETVLETSEGVDVWQGPIPPGKSCELPDGDLPDLAARVLDVDKDAIAVCTSGLSSASRMHGTANANGYVFFCNSATQKECATLKLLGSHERAFEHMKHAITPATHIFLFNFDDGKLLGIFAAVGEPELNINPRAFNRRFNAQVRVTPRGSLREAKLMMRPSAGGKTASEVAALVALFSGEAPEYVQKAWYADSDEPPSKRLCVKDAESFGTADDSGRPFNSNQVVVNFANIGASYAEKVLGRDPRRGERIFDWEGVRRCISTLIEEEGMQVIGVLFENFKGPDNGSQLWQGVPLDIVQMCTFIQETPRLTGRNHKSADDEVTIKCAFRRNCRFLDNDNYRDWLNNMRNPKVRAWLEKWQDLLQMRYFFDAQMGTFDTLDGNISVGELTG